MTWQRSWVPACKNSEAPSSGKLGYLAPPVLFRSGNLDLLVRGFLAVVGSRSVDAAGEAFAEEVGKACAREGRVLLSGGAKGVDQISMTAALRSGGEVVGVLAERLEFAVRDQLYRTAIADGRLALLSAVRPKAPFSTANAMARNKYVYCLARYGLVVSSSEKRGGTWSGASEVLRHRWRHAEPSHSVAESGPRPMQARLGI